MSSKFPHATSANVPANKSVIGDIAGGLLKNPEVQNAIFGSIASIISGLFAGLIAKLTGQGKHVTVPAADRPGTIDEDFKDDKIVAPPKVTPAPSTSGELAKYTGATLNISKAQYNRELFEREYTPDNQFGLYRPARQDVYNRRSKIWFNVTPRKGDHAVQYDEGKKDGILWDPVYHFLYNGAETVCKANKNTLQDTVNGAQRPIQVVEGESVGIGFSSWDYTYGFVPQIQVGDNEGGYEVWVTFPMLNNLESEHVKFTVS